MSDTIVIGIDCGQGGGAVISWSAGKMTCHATPTNSEGDLKSIIREVLMVAHVHSNQVNLFIERNTGFIAGKGRPGARMFTMGRSYEYPFGIADALGLEVKLVQPRAWQDWIGLPQGMDYKPRKDRSAAIALKRYPFAVDLGPTKKAIAAVADAAHIAAYGRYLLETPTFEVKKRVKRK